MELRQYSVIKLGEERHVLCKRKWFLFIFPYNVCFKAMYDQTYAWTSSLYDAKKFFTPEAAVKQLNDLEEVKEKQFKKQFKAGLVVWSGDSRRTISLEEELTFRLGDALRHGRDHEVDGLMKRIKELN